MGRFWIKQGPFTQNFAKQPNFFLFPKFLELSLTIKNTPPKVKTQSLTKVTFFLGHPVVFWVIGVSRDFSISNMIQSSQEFSSWNSSLENY